MARVLPIGGRETATIKGLSLNDQRRTANDGL